MDKISGTGSLCLYETKSFVDYPSRILRCIPIHSARQWYIPKTAEYYSELLRYEEAALHICFTGRDKAPTTFPAYMQ